jgi:simple sugar transport system substrate-binding protein
MNLTRRILFFCLCLVFAAGSAFAADKKIKAGFIYVGPVGDYGFSYGHD